MLREEPERPPPIAHGGIAPDGGRRWPARVLLSLLLAAAALWFAANAVERRGVAFYRTGRSVAELLAGVAGDLRAGDLERLADRIAPDYRGRSLGLAELQAAGERDGVRVYRFGVAAGPPGSGRRQAVDEWRRYLAGFSSVDEVGLHLERLERWEDAEEIVAIVRFELVGTPVGEPRAGEDRALFRMRFARPAGGGEGLTLAGASPIGGGRVIADSPQFTDVSAAAGIDFENRYYPPYLSEPLRFRMLRHGPAGITAADYDGDGLDDLFIPDGVESRLYRNRGDGGFEDVTAAAGLGGLDGVGVGLFADIDGDGDRDLFVSRTFRPNQLFRNDGDGTFTDATAGSGIGADCCTTVASFADVDRDGDLDLYVGRYLDPRTAIPVGFYSRNGEPNKLYRNDGGGTFTDVTDEAGVGDTGLCLGTAFGDFDDDGWPDLFVANDFGRKTLYRNDGDGTFTDVTVAAGALAYGAGMSANLGDVDNDGHLDLYVTHIRSDQRWFAAPPTTARYLVNVLRRGSWRASAPLAIELIRQSGPDFNAVIEQMSSGNTLLRNRGDGTFEDITERARANPPGWFWGAVFADFDNDGWLDLYAADGWVYGERGTELELDFLEGVIADQEGYATGAPFDPDRFGGRSWHGWERNRHLRNDGPDGAGRIAFTEIGRAAGSDLLLNSRGVAVADFWNRGAVDLAVAASTGRHALLRNEAGPGHHWLGVEVRGAADGLPRGSNRDGVGARVTVRAGGLRQLREVNLGDGYASQSSLRLHFGLGAANLVDELSIRWPRSGIVQRFAGLPADRLCTATEGIDLLDCGDAPLR